MTNRRKFLQQVSIYSLTSALLPSTGFTKAFSGTKTSMPFGIQLYSISGSMTSDAKGTLQKVVNIGYQELESAGSVKGYYYGYTPKEFQSWANSMGLHWRSHHVIGAPTNVNEIKNAVLKAFPGDSTRQKDLLEQITPMAKLPTLNNDTERLVQEAAEGGVDYLVCGSMPVSNLNEIKKAVEVFNKAGEACKKAGVQFVYHNHATEFDQVEGHRPFDYILSNTDKDLVKMELDLAWATIAGQDPVALFAQHPHRFPLWHVKDVDKNTKQTTEVGSGIVDFKRIFDNAEKSGAKYFFVEQDGAPQPLQNVTNSYRYLKKC